MENKLLYSSRMVKIEVQTSSEELSNYIKEQKKEALVMIENRKERLNIKNTTNANKS